MSRKTRPDRGVFFQNEFREDLRFWIDTNRRVALKIMDLVEAVAHDPFGGIGKPEPLKHLGANVWSRRITQDSGLKLLGTANAVSGDRSRG